MDSKIKESLEFIEDCFNSYKNIAVVCSFGKDSMVVLDLVRRVNPEIKVLWIRPPFLPMTTISFGYRTIMKWGLNAIALRSPLVRDKEFMENVVNKPKIWKTNPELCCQIFKVDPAKIGVKELKLNAWFSGMRKTESEKRGMYTRIWKQGSFTKLHPIIDFTEADTWRYIATHNVPVHPWYRLGYRSLGCEPCSFPNEWKSERGGRWKDTMMEGGDCGIHCQPMISGQKKEE